MAAMRAGFIHEMCVSALIWLIVTVLSQFGIEFATISGEKGSIDAHLLLWAVNVDCGALASNRNHQRIVK
ncbi:hypothetical protein G5B40_00110 [Pikeienuella piscinae]|uniref:Uncharacterized protein n=1 Tax=Pikeienuella piscinae TaxID=2748098 RepID=A0A7L5BSR2_9RHOB|nr:hypothetical protein [Pikeienuella piscinae]QIE53982.1 hypothetical protein G5B40_00110 [Pikeienuella piscinae]